MGVPYSSYLQKPGQMILTPGLTLSQSISLGNGLSTSANFFGKHTQDVVHWMPDQESIPWPCNCGILTKPGLHQHPRMNRFIRVWDVEDAIPNPHNPFSWLGEAKVVV
jgi:hypothetical protein